MALRSRPFLLNAVLKTSSATAASKLIHVWVDAFPLLIGATATCALMGSVLRYGKFSAQAWACSNYSDTFVVSLYLVMLIGIIHPSPHTHTHICG